MTKDIDNIEHLVYDEAIDKIKEITDHTRTCMFTTNLETLPLNARPMSLAEVDSEGRMWFISSTSSEKNKNILKDPRVQLFFSNPSKAEFLSIYGTAAISKDAERIDRFWSPFAESWFEQGKDDPEVSLIMVNPEKAFYWDTKHNKVIYMLSVLKSMFVGEPPKEGVKGELKL